MKLCAIAFAFFLLGGAVLFGQQAPSALLLDGPGPWREAAWQSAAREFRGMLQDAGYRVRAVAPPQLENELRAAPAALVAAPSLEPLPLGAFKAIAAHAAKGGSLLATGGEPFREPMHQTASGEWITLRELLARAPRTVIVEPVSARLRRANRPPEGVASQETVAGPEGKRDSLQITIAKPVRIDPLQTEAFSRSPFTNGQTMTIVTVKGTPEESLLIEWREDDGLRWWARVPLTREWRTHVLRPSDFSSPPTGGRAQSGRTRFEPARARVLAFGLATEVNTPATAPVDFAVGPIAVATAPDIEDFAAPVLETISPWYKQYDAKRQGRAVRIPIARGRGLTAATETEGRYQTIGPLLDPAASRYVTAAGAALFWLPLPELPRQNRDELVALLRETANRLVLLDGGASEFVAFQSERVALGARVLNASAKAMTANIAWEVRQGGRSLRRQTASVQLAPGETRDINAEAVEPLAPGEYTVETRASLDAVACDRIEGYLRVVDPQASRAPNGRLRVENGHFVAGGKRVFLNGVNYWPRNVSGLEAPRYWDHWVTPRNYDPDVVEADLAALEALGFNLVSIQYSRLEQGRPMIDFLERCARHGIWVHISIGSAQNLRLNPERDIALLKAALLPGTGSVFGYELAWEPHLGNHAARAAFDAAWRNWILEQYGSEAAAEQAWGMPAPRGADGGITNPADDQLGTDGPHRVMVAAYRRFVDDLVSRTYGKAVRHLRTLDPDALIAVRTGWGGTGQRGNNVNMGYDLGAGAAHLDAVSPEGYGMPAAFEEARRTGFVTAYGRWAGNGKPVLWLEFGASVGPRDGTSRTRRNQTLLCETTMRMIADSGADGSAVWWFPGGWRFNERSDFGVFNPDGSPRDSARVISDWAKKLNAGGIEPGSGEPVAIEIDRDSDARGLNGLWTQFGGDFVKAREAGRPVRLVSRGTGTDTGNMPLVQAGNAPWKGAGPPKYANAEMAGIRIAWAGGEKVVENGAELEVPANAEVQVTVSLVNTGEAAWLAAGDGACRLRTSAGESAVREKVARFGKTTLEPLRIKLGVQAVELTGRVEAAGKGAFGETLKIRLNPR